ncbi:hypothetical protein HanXRQr2_Chr14g0670331 [Helianthus annuus]|uniref:Uncharacterized protein n=1 Tax=Helianthus annuus TaxID=4232 RepID=A0A9K3H9S8_HELAN|nr:hypothetical protein HanXRQr2_Chr14g0670331 [Helianthus annuus]
MMTPKAANPNQQLVKESRVQIKAGELLSSFDVTNSETPQFYKHPQSHNSLSHQPNV